MEHLGMFTEPWHWFTTADAARDDRDADGRLFRNRITTILLQVRVASESSLPLLNALNRK
jgi:hypothetical protein